MPEAGVTRLNSTYLDNILYILYIVSAQMVRRQWIDPTKIVKRVIMLAFARILLSSE